MNIVELKNLLSFEYDRRAIIYASILIIIISAIFTALMGFKALIVLAALALIWAALKSRMNLVWVYLSMQPLLFMFSYTLANISGYLLAFILITGWLAGKMLYGFDGAEFSKPLIIIMFVFLFLATASILPNGINRIELYVYIRILILFSFTIVFYDIFKPKHVYILFVAMSIPLIINCFIMINIFLSQRTLVDFLMLYRLKVGGLFPHPNLAGYFILVGSPFWIAMFL